MSWENPVKALGKEVNQLVRAHARTLQREREEREVYRRMHARGLLLPSESEETIPHESPLDPLRKEVEHYVRKYNPSTDGQATMFGRIVVLNKEKKPWLIVDICMREYLIGRNPACIFQIDRPAVNLFHSCITIRCKCTDDEQAKLRDRGSASRCSCPLSDLRVELHNMVYDPLRSTKYNFRPMSLLPQDDAGRVLLSDEDQFSVLGAHFVYFAPQDRGLSDASNVVYVEPTHDPHRDVLM